MIIKCLRNQKGATAIEFAIVFSLFFGIVWATISYAMPLFLNQVMNHAVAEGARFALRADPDQDPAVYEAQLLSLATQRINQELTVLPASFRTNLQTTVSIQQTGINRHLVVNLTYPNYNTQPIIPVLTLPGLGPIPNLPGDLRASSRFRLSN
jgi:Flp pilus assembly protein TadG